MSTLVDSGTGSGRRRDPAVPLLSDRASAGLSGARAIGSRLRWIPGSFYSCSESTAAAILSAIRALAASVVWQ